MEKNQTDGRPPPKPLEIGTGGKTLIVVASIVFSLVLAEMGLRIFLPFYAAGDIGLYQYDEELGVRTQPNVNRLKLTDFLQESVTNAYGTVNYSDDFSGWEKIVFTIGDSFTQGTGVSPDAAYPFQLDLALNAQEGGYKKQYAVINLGLGSYGLMQETITARRFAKLIRSPDYILQLGVVNDLSDDVAFRSGYRHEHLVQGNPRWYGLAGELGWLAESVEIIKRTKLAIGAFRQWRAGMAYDEPRGSPTMADSAAAPSAASQMEKQYLELKALSDELGAKLILSWGRCEGTPDGDGSYPWLKQWSADNGVPFADWCDTALSILTAQPKLALSNPHSAKHYKPWTNRIIADAFAGEILRAASGQGVQTPSPQPTDGP